MKSKFFIILVLFLLDVASSSFLPWDDPEFTQTRKEIREWWITNGPKPVHSCSKKDHDIAIASYTQPLSETHCKQVVTTLQNLLLMANDKPFFGVNETFQAIRQRKAEVIFLGANKYISVYDYRNPFSGNHQYVVCEGSNCDSRTEISDGTDYGKFFLRSCMSFPEFVHKYMRRSSPTIASLFCHSTFFNDITNIGGYLKKGFLLHEAQPIKTEIAKGYRKYLMVYKV